MSGSSETNATGRMNISVQGAATASVTASTMINILLFMYFHNSFKNIFSSLFYATKIGKNREKQTFCAKSEYKNPKENTRALLEEVVLKVLILATPCVQQGECIIRRGALNKDN